MANQKMNVRTGDTVVVISGKDRGKKGKVLRVIPEKRRVVVEGVNQVKKHVRPNRKVMQGGIITQENPIDASNVMLVCRSCGKPTRHARRVLESGKTVRRCVRCGEDQDD